MRHGAKILSSMAVAGTLLLGACESRQDQIEQNKRERAQKAAEYKAMTPMEKFHYIVDESIKVSLSDADIGALGWGYCEFWQANNHNPEPAMAQLDEWIIHDFNVSPSDAIVVHAAIREAFCPENY